VREVKRTKAKGKEGIVKAAANVRVVPAPENVIDALRTHRRHRTRRGPMPSTGTRPAGYSLTGRVLPRPVNISRDIRPWRRTPGSWASVPPVPTHSHHEDGKENVHVRSPRGSPVIGMFERRSPSTPHVTDDDLKSRRGAYRPARANSQSRTFSERYLGKKGY